MADASLWPTVVGGLIAVGGTIAGVIGTALLDVVQQRNEKKKPRTEKFAELVAAVYEFDRWLMLILHRELFGHDGIPQAASPLAKVQSITSVYFPQFSKLVDELSLTSTGYVAWIYGAKKKRLAQDSALAQQGFDEKYLPYAAKRNALLDALSESAQKEFQ